MSLAYQQQQQQQRGGRGFSAGFGVGYNFAAIPVHAALAKERVSPFMAKQEQEQEEHVRLEQQQEAIVRKLSNLSVYMQQQQQQQSYESQQSSLPENRPQFSATAQMKLPQGNAAFLPRKNGSTPSPAISFGSDFSFPSSTPSCESSPRVSEAAPQAETRAFCPSSSFSECRLGSFLFPTFEKGWSASGIENHQVHSFSTSASSRNDDEGGRHNLSGSDAESPGTPKQPERACGMEFPSADASSSSLSFSDSRDDSSGASVDGKHERGDIEVESSLHRMASPSLQKRGLSSHFSGKSRSFTSLADVANIQSIQDLAKPETSISKRRRGLHNSLLLERHRTFPLRSVDGAISKKSGIRGGSSLAVAVAMSAAEGRLLMETLVEDVAEGSSQKAFTLLDGDYKMNGAALQDSWRRVWQHGRVTTPEKKSSLRRYSSAMLH